MDAVEGGCGEGVVGGFAVLRARLADERGGAFRMVGEEGRLGVGARVVFEVVGGRAVFAEEFFWRARTLVGGGRCLFLGR